MADEWTISRPRRTPGAVFRRSIPWGVVLGIGVLVCGMCLATVTMDTTTIRLLAVPVGISMFVLLLVFSFLMRRVRRRRATVLLSYLEQAVRLNLPLVPWLSAATHSERGAIRTRLADLGLFLSHGMPVACAAGQAVPELTERQVAVIEAAERTGRLSAALRRLVTEARFAASAENPDRVFRMVYPLLVTLSVMAVTSMLMIFVVPKFEQIFRDFATPLPRVTIVLMNVSRVAGIWLLLGCVVWLLLAFTRALTRLFIDVRCPPVWRPVVDRVHWWLPPLRQTTRSRQWADFCNAMTGALEGAMPFETALDEATAAATNIVARQRLAAWHQHLLSGQLPAEAARQAGMPAIMSGLLATAHHGEDAAAVFRFLARHYDAQFSRLRAILSAASVPLITLFFAAIVGFIAFGLFVPLLRLIDATQLTIWSGL